MNRQIDKLMMYRFWVGTAITVLLMSITGAIVYWLTREATPEMIEDFARLFPPRSREALRPEFKEQWAFYWCVFTLPLWGFAAYQIVRRLNRINSLVFQGILWFIPVWSIGAMVMSREYFEFMFKPLMGIGAVVAPVMAILFAWILYKKKIRINKWWWFGAGMLLFVLQVYTTRIFFPEYVNYVGRWHFGVVSQAVSIASTGLLSCSQYGYFAYFLLPFMALTGFSVIKLSLVMGVLYATAMGCLLWVLVKVLNRKWLVLAAAMTLALTYSAISLHVSDFDPYFQYHPIRTFWPCCTLLAAFLIARKSRPLRGGIIGGVMAAVALFWNIDSGVVLCVAFPAWFGWNAFCRRDRSWWIALLANVVSIIGMTACILTVFSFWNGGMLSLTEITKFQRVFMYGYFLLPMPFVLHVWSLVALLYVTAFLLGVWCVYRNPAGIRGQMYFMLGLIGIGIFPYYQGRSADGNLVNISYLAVVIMVLWIDALSTSVKRLRLRTPLLWPWLTMVIALGMFCGVYLYDLPVTIKLVGQITGRFTDRKPEYYADIQFIREHAPADKVANIIGEGQGFYSLECGLTPGFLPFNYGEVIMRSDFAYLLENLVVSQRPLFVTARRLAHEWEPPEEYFEQFFDLKAVSPSGKVRYYLPKPLESIELNRNSHEQTD